MALFGKKKDETEHKDTIDIKQQAGSPPPFSLNNNLDNQQQQMENPFTNNNMNMGQQQMQQFPEPNQQQMQNPFANNNMDMEQQQMQQFPEPNQQQMQNPLPSFNSQSSFSPDSMGLTEEQIQELIDETVEKIIDDKWETITSNIEKVVSWKEKVENDVHLLKEDIVAIKNAFENLEKKLSSKIGSYDKNILDVNSEIKALEKVFQKITPTLVNNVNELSKIAKELKSVDKDKTNRIKN